MRVLSVLSIVGLVASQYNQPAQQQPQYQPQQQPQYIYVPPPPPPQLVDNYVCSIEGNYGLYGERRPHFRPQPAFCINAGVKEDSCQRCCKMSAQIQNSNVNESQISGFIAVIEKSSLCVCCAPRSVLAVAQQPQQTTYVAQSPSGSAY
ncbi:unnamed protein product [Caenorhabditis angaria]|uniref:Uncharacterized protein n=1 Tax=Caenorhabditis angaria TaxID=860376 RepID=A0A9P1N218_9PELO|nr:unnamed protein product [Caenorhabditis angaria]